MTIASTNLFGMLSELLGGVGLFLVGMILMTDGLKAAAGGALRRVLERSTGRPAAAFLSGMGLTALVQSSSATTIATIGFVSAGLLSLPGAVGVIIGANVGTTSTGWIVALLGFKLNVSAAALPLIGAGALLRLLAAGRRASLGMALAGFGLIFVGIEYLQGGMGELAQRLDLSGLRSDALGGRAMLVLIGALMTVLLQSSSAAVALTLAALHGGAIDLVGAAYLVIGQNLGTTVTALLAAAGAAVPARRAALAHVLFNAATGAATFGAAPALLALVTWVAGAASDAGPAVTLALFHTAFNLAGALLFLPFTGPLARGITRLIPDRGPPLTRHLDRSLLQVPAVAIAAAARVLRDVAAAALAEAARPLAGASLGRDARPRLQAAEAALREAKAFLAQVRLDQHHRQEYRQRLSLLHAGDHLARLVEAELEQERALAGPEALAAGQRLAPVLAAAAAWLSRPGAEGPSVAERPVERLAEASTGQAEARRGHRLRLLARTAAGELAPDEAQARLEAMRWVDRVAYHAWRAAHHLAGAETAADSAIDAEAEAAAEPERDERAPERGSAEHRERAPWSDAANPSEETSHE